MSTRTPLRLQSLQKVAVPIRSQRPMFDENYIVKKDNDPDKERAELKSLKRKLKREEKAMARDGKYLSEGASIANGSTVVDIFIPPPSFKLVSLSLSRSPLSKTSKQVFFNPINIYFDIFLHTLYLLFL